MLVIGYINYQFIRIVHLDLTILDKPLKNKKIKILFASDIHLGFMIDKCKFQKYVKLINEQYADLVIFTGDISDN
jgi:predicted MPP superfamily phosphohydrolase